MSIFAYDWVIDLTKSSNGGVELPLILKPGLVRGSLRLPRANLIAHFNPTTDSVGLSTLVDKSGNANDVSAFSYCPTLAGTEVLTLAHLTGSETVATSYGTSTPVVGSGQITFDAGTIQYILLSDGTELVFEGINGTANDTIYNVDGTENHGTFASPVTFDTLINSSYIAKYGGWYGLKNIVKNSYFASDTDWSGRVTNTSVIIANGQAHFTRTDAASFVRLEQVLDAAPEIGIEHMVIVKFDANSVQSGALYIKCGGQEFKLAELLYANRNTGSEHAYYRRFTPTSTTVDFYVEISGGNVDDTWIASEVLMGPSANVIIPSGAVDVDNISGVLAARKNMAALVFPLAVKPAIPEAFSGDTPLEVDPSSMQSTGAKMVSSKGMLMYNPSISGSNLKKALSHIGKTEYKIGLFADSHYVDGADINRFGHIVDRWNADKVDAVIGLGDIYTGDSTWVDAADMEADIAAIEGKLSILDLKTEILLTLGNHDIPTYGVADSADYLAASSHGEANSSHVIGNLRIINFSTVIGATSYGIDPTALNHLTSNLTSATAAGQIDRKSVV